MQANVKKRKIKKRKKKKNISVLFINNTAEIAAVLNMLGMQVDIQQFFKKYTLFYVKKKYSTNIIEYNFKVKI